MRGRVRRALQPQTPAPGAGTPGDGGEGSVGDGGGERGGEDGVAMSLSPANGGEGAASLPAVAWEVMAA